MNVADVQEISLNLTHAVSPDNTGSAEGVNDFPPVVYPDEVDVTS